MWLTGRWLFPSLRQQPHDLLFPSGSSSKTIAAELQRAGVMRSRFAFELLHYAMPRKTLKAGEYRFVHAATGLKSSTALHAEMCCVHTVVVPEGYNIFEIAAAVEAAGLGKKEDFIKVATHDTALVPSIDPAGEIAGRLPVPRHISVLARHEHA